MFNEFKNGIIDLSIDDGVKLEQEIRNKDAKITELESDKEKRISELEDKVKSLVNLYELSKAS